MKYKNILMILGIATVTVAMTGCGSTPSPTFNQSTSQTESEYKPYLRTGSGSVAGQAFFVQSGGVVVKAAGRTVTLDPATTTGKEWWIKAGKHYAHRSIVPSSSNFKKARRKTVADAEGRFKFRGIPTGNYFIRTDVTWHVPSYGIQGGLVGKQITVRNGKTTELILNEYAQ